VEGHAWYEGQEEVKEVSEAERAARWRRVSGNSQDYESQTASIDRHVASHGYADAGISYELKASAMKGEHVAELERVIEDAQAGLFTVLVISDSARIERRDENDEVILFLARMRAAGARVESASEPMFGQRDIGGRIITVLSQHANAEYVRKLAFNTGRGFSGVAERGAFIGAEPSFFVSTGDRRNKRLVAAEHGIKYIPGILERIVHGESLREIARWLTREGVPAGRGEGKRREDGTAATQWWPKTVSAVVRNTACIGRVACSMSIKDESGQPVKLAWIHEFEPVADEALWRAANAQLNGRTSEAGHLGGKAIAKEPLSGNTWCKACARRGVRSPLYRMGGYAGGDYYRLRCYGRGADRMGCGQPLIPVSVAYEMLDAYFAGPDGLMPEYEIRRIPGNKSEVDARLARLQADEVRISATIARNAEERAAKRAALAQLDEEYARVEAIEVIPDSTRLAPTGEYVADLWADPERRARLLMRYTAAFGVADGTEHVSAEWTRAGGSNQFFQGDPVTTTFGAWIDPDYGDDDADE
jgi:hypothetical protein